MLCGLAGCGGEQAGGAPDAGGSAPVSEAVEARAQAEAPVEAPAVEHAPLAAGDEVLVEAGTVRAGSRPGTEGRDPRREADLVPVEIPAFHIDRLPYPNDPGEPPRTGVTRTEAAELCEAQGKRLCTELEWERACKGDTTLEYAGGDDFDVEGCGLDPLSCASPLDVVQMGVTTFEWTASDVSRHLGTDVYSAVLRGGRATDPAPEHRCGARHALAPDDAGPSIGFRCCRGAMPELTYPDEPARRVFREREVEPDRLREILRSVPELARFADGFRQFDAAQIDRALARGDHTRESVQWNFPEQVLVWSPVAGEEIWVFAGTDGTSSLVAALYPMPDGTFVHGASFVLRDEPAPIALAWDWGSRDEVLWSACWSCTGEGGAVAFRDDYSLVVLQR